LSSGAVMKVIGKGEVLDPGKISPEPLQEP